MQISFFDGKIFLRFLWAGLWNKYGAIVASHSCAFGIFIELQAASNQVLVARS